MRILHVLDHSLPKQSGYVFRTMSIVAEQRARGWDPILVTTPRHGAGDKTHEDIGDWRIYRTPNNEPAAWTPAGLKEWFEIKTTAQHLRGLVEEIKPDILHAHSPVLNFFPAKAAAGNRPVVYEIRAFWEDAAVDHGTTKEGSLRYRLSRALETRAIKRASHVTTICDGLRQDIIGRGVAPEKITIIPNAVNVDNFPPIEACDEQLKASLGLSGKTILGFIGSFYGYEGLTFLIKSFPALKARNPDAALLFVGGGPSEGKMRAAVKDLGLETDVIFTGRVPHEDVRRYYSVADIMVYPRHSMRLTETVTPLKPLEAMALKKLVLASDIGGHRELIENGKTGRLFKADDASDLVEVCSTLINERESWQSYHEAGRHFVENVRNWHASVARYEAIYEKLLKRR
ncbi:TIGR04063 family PEP-CTERM/XrtA system glycosyltransferase [Kordiimonas sp.]|uniref:TIGR04063 family PEP-CTERM/XrtA system glycosyltransferase n=1 Tax=Kordiimonas sp. TaxID=1970157 RepID=UPI003A932812